jgi:AcrR family transcriptional regulator
MRLFAERGYDAVSMSDIAEATGSSRRTVFRYFPSKAELVWAGLDEANERMLSSLAGSPPTQPVFDAVRNAYASSLRLPEGELDVTRMRLSLISAHVELLAYGTPKLAPMRAELARFIRDRTGAPDDDLEPLVLADVLVGASMTALGWWASHSDLSPLEVVERVLQRIEAGFADEGRFRRSGAAG